MAEFTINRLGRSMARIRIEGTAPLICNRFSEKAKRTMLGNQRGEARTRAPKNPEANYQASLYPMPGDRYGFPATGPKAAIVEAARFFKGSKLSMTALKPSVLVKGYGSDVLVEIDGQPKMREDIVRNATGVADIRHRGEFWPWAMDLDIVWVTSMLTVESLAALVDGAGFIGLGEWRPGSKKSTSGMYGTFVVADDQDIQVVTL